MFKKLKHLFVAEPVLKHPDLVKSFVIQTNASDVVLLQKNLKGDLQLCAYTSQNLSDAERHWVIWEKEVFTVLWLLLTLRHFLEGSKVPFEVWTNHKNLEMLKMPRRLSPNLGSIFQLVSLHALLPAWREKLPSGCIVQDTPVKLCKGGGHSIQTDSGTNSHQATKGPQRASSWRWDGRLSPITRVINLVMVELKLPKNLKCVHPIFHCSLLKPDPSSPLRPAMKSPPPPIMIEGEQHFEVKEILDSKLHKGML